MKNASDLFNDLNEIMDNGPFGKNYVYTPMTDERYQISCANDIAEWAEAIQGEWDGDNAGRLEDRAHCADDIIGKCNELKELIAEMENL